jgi:PBSX family phage portal protein
VAIQKNIKAPKSKMTATVTKVVRKIETLTSQSIEQSDPFFQNKLYEAQAGGVAVAIAPPYDPNALWQRYEANSFLFPCIEAMKANIAGTGFEIVLEDQKAEDAAIAANKDVQKLQAFFKQPWPGQSFLSIRKDLSDDLEITGNAYLEVIRNLAGAVVMLRRLSPILTRLSTMAMPMVSSLKLPHMDGEVQMITRPKVFVQIIGGNRRYFKEFGATAQLSSRTGKWEAGSYTPAPGEQVDANLVETQVPPAERATEIIHLKCVDHPSGYGIPRWVTQTPSVVGTRKAEEQNNSFFDNGGIPPMVIFISGGDMTEDSRKAISEVLYSDGVHKTMGAVVEIHGTEGSMDKPASVPNVTVERFGAEKVKDSMFENYLIESEKRIRGAFRLPPLFVGRTDDFTYATAYASYVVAEAQVFLPERSEFDEIMNLKLLPAILGKKNNEGTEAVFKSNPVVPQNIDAFLTALGFVKDVASRTSVIEALNDTLGMNLQEKTQQEIDAEKPAPPVIDPTQKPANSNAKPTATTGQKPQQPPKATQKADKPLLKLLSKSLSQLVRGKRLDQDQMISLVTQVQSLTKAERDQLREDMLWELDMPDNADQDLMDLLSATVESHTGVSLN